MATVAEMLEGLRVGEGTTHGRLTLFPVFGDAEAAPEYLTLREALEAGSARVTEVSGGGSVPELLFVNEGGRPVLLLDGEELVGAKQNRILNLTILAPPKSTLKVPVACVEAGRWSLDPETMEFSVAERVHFAEGRARKAAAVNASLRMRGEPRADQHEVWAGIEDRMEMLSVRSPTRASEELYRSRGRELESYVSAFRPADGQVGVIAAIDGRLLGVELFDSPATLARCLPKIVRSWALDAISPLTGAELGGIAAEDPAVLLEAVRTAPVRRYPATGLGEDVRIEGARVAGGALEWQGRIVHLVAFTRPAGREERDDGTETLQQARFRAWRYRRG